MVSGTDGLKHGYIRILGLYRIGDRFSAVGVDDEKFRRVVLGHIPWFMRWLYRLEVVPVEVEYMEEVYRIQLEAYEDGLTYEPGEDEVVN